MHDHAPGLIRLATRLAGSADAEDLVQATYVRALEHGDAVRRRRSWLRQVLVNERRMEQRSRHRRDVRDQASADLHEPAADVEHVVHTLEVARIVGELVDGLDADVRTVVRERYFDGDTSAEIARRHEIPAGTVRWRLKSGLDQLRDQLDARFGGRRAMWAGAFVPALESTAPTLGSPAASKTAMSIKLIVGAGIVAATAGTVVVASSSFSPEPTPAAAPALPASPAKVQAAAVSPSPSQSQAEASNEQPTEDDGARLKAAWEDRRSKIRKAHAKAEGFSWQAADEDGDEDAGLHEVGTCNDKACVAELGAEIHELIKGCKDMMDEMPEGLVLDAQVIGAPDVGTVVESVEVVAGEGSPELVECLTQQMYALDLGETESNFEHSFKMSMGSQLALGPLEAADLDEQTRQLLENALPAGAKGAKVGRRSRAELEAALAAKGLTADGETTVHVLTVDSFTHDPDAPERAPDE